MQANLLVLFFAALAGLGSMSVVHDATSQVAAGLTPRSGDSVQFDTSDSWSTKDGSWSSTDGDTPYGTGGSGTRGPSEPSDTPPPPQEPPPPSYSQASYYAEGSYTGGGAPHPQTSPTPSVPTQPTQPPPPSLPPPPSVEPYQSAPRTLDESSQTTSPDSAQAHPGTAEPSQGRTPQQNARAPQPIPRDVSVKKIEDIGSYVNRFRAESDALRQDVQKLIESNVDQTLQTVGAPESIRPFDPAAREALIANLRPKIQERQTALSNELRDAAVLAPPGEQAQQIQSVLRSSVEDISLLIQAEVGMPVDIALDERAVTTEIQARSESLTESRESLVVRDGLDLYADRDNDGISDYDEKHIYGTNPYDAYTGGSYLTDGERVLLGFDALSTSTAQVAVESPAIAGVEVKNVYEVDTIAVEPAATDSPAASTTERVVFAGRGLPNSFVTLYIFSTPIVVTVKADADGRWQYELDKELPDGDHELYVATIDNAGRILAKSPAVPFVKTAEAAEFTPLTIAPVVSDVAPVDVLADNFYIAVIFVLLIFLLFALIILGIRGLRAGPGAPTAP